MCGRLSLGCDVIPAELQVHFKSMCGERVEHINRRITNYRKVSVRPKPAITLVFVCQFSKFLLVINGSFPSLLLHICKRESLGQTPPLHANVRERENK